MRTCHRRAPAIPVARISPTGGVTTYIAGLAVPVDLDFSPQGELVVCELGRERVAAFRSPEKVRVVASGLRGPHGLAFDKSGVTFINEWSGNRVVKVSPGGRVEPVANIEVPVGLALGSPGTSMPPNPRSGKSPGSSQTAPGSP